jgi:hypothetical protein
MKSLKGGTLQLQKRTPVETMSLQALGSHEFLFAALFPRLHSWFPECLVSVNRARTNSKIQLSGIERW